MPALTCTLSTTPSKISWADDDDFDLDTWKSTADLSCPETLPPLQLPEPDPEPLYKSYTTGESAPWAARSSPSTSTTFPPKVDWFTTDPRYTDPRCAAPLLAWRAVEKVPGMPAYKEMGDYWGRRVGYAQNWAWMKAGSGWECRGAVMLRGSGLKAVQSVEEDEEELEEVGLRIIMEEDEEEEEEIEVQEVVVVEEEKEIEALQEHAAEAAVIEEEKVVDAAEPIAIEVVEVASKQYLAIQPIDLTLLSKPALEILPVDIAPITPPVELRISPVEVVDFVPFSTTYIPLETAPAVPIALHRPIQDEGYFTDASLSPPLSPTLTSIGLAPVAIFAKPPRKQQRRDSQQALHEHGGSSGASKDTVGNIEDIMLDYHAPVVSLEDTEGRQDAATLSSKDADLAPILLENSGATKMGWYTALSMSWTTVALITAGVLAGGAMCFGRQRR